MIKCGTAAFAALAASSLLTSAVLFNTAQADSFIADFSLNHYDDLKAAFGNDTSAASVHWQTYGIPESRRGYTQYSGVFYRYLYPDIVNVHGSDYRAILTHWNISGINEGRRASREFDASYYLSQYPDLQAAFGTELGCGKAIAQTADADGWYWAYVVCQYSAAGNVTGQYAY